MKALLCRRDKNQCASPQEGLGKEGPPSPQNNVGSRMKWFGTDEKILLAVLAVGFMHLPILFWGRGVHEHVFLC